MFHAKYTGIIPEKVLKEQRVDLEENLSGMFKVFVRSLFSNMNEDEIYTDQSTIASVMLLNKVLDSINLTNAVQLSVNDKVVFKDVYDNDDDLSEMIYAVEQARIRKLDSAEIVMEDYVDDLHLKYYFHISKRENNITTLLINIGGIVEEQGGSDNQTFQDEIDILINELETFNVDFDI